jgi:hypothetical protein
MQNGSGTREAKIISSTTRRHFNLQGLFFENGCFIIISEGEPRIGAVSVSISSTTSQANTAKVIPSKYDSIFLDTISEKVSSMTSSICLVSLYTRTPLQLDDMKAIMAEVMNMVRVKKDVEKHE